MKRLLVILCLFGTKGALAAIINGSFEAPKTKGIQWLDGTISIPGWKGESVSYGAGYGAPPASKAKGNYHGRQVFYLLGVGSYIEQTVKIERGVPFELSFVVGSGRPSRGFLIEASVTDAYGKTIIREFTVSTTSQPCRFSFVGTAPTASIRFTYTSTSNESAWIDSVTLKPTKP